MWSCTTVLYLLFVVRFFARRAKKRTTDAMGSTMLPQAKRRLMRDRVSPVIVWCFLPDRAKNTRQKVKIRAARTS